MNDKEQLMHYQKMQRAVKEQELYSLYDLFIDDEDVAGESDKD